MQIQNVNCRLKSDLFSIKSVQYTRATLALPRSLNTSLDKYCWRVQWMRKWARLTSKMATCVQLIQGLDFPSKMITRACRLLSQILNSKSSKTYIFDFFFFVSCGPGSNDYLFWVSKGVVKLEYPSWSSLPKNLQFLNKTCNFICLHQFFLRKD